MKTATRSSLDPQRWSLLDSLYHSARQLEPAARSSFLAESCSGDDELHRDLLSLLRSDETTDSFLEEPAFELGLRVLRQPREDLTGTEIDRYRLLSRLGSGGMGDVYLAQDTRLGRSVALKLLNPDILKDRQNLERFEQEARLTSATSHPSVPHIYEISDAEGRPFITMEYVAGSTLRQLLKKGPVPIADAVNYVAQILSALAAAHRANVIHRDIKPENVIITEDGTVKVLDFGLAKLLPQKPAGDEGEPDIGATLHTTPELLMGTSHYMSPEQVRRGPIDFRTDVWSTGVVLYELLCGRRPFQGQDPTAVMLAVLEQSPEPFATAERRVPAPLQALTLKALSKLPDERFQTAEEMNAELMRIATELGIGDTNGRAAYSSAPARTPLEVALDSAATGAGKLDRATQVTDSQERKIAASPGRFGVAGKIVALLLAVLLAVGASYLLFFRHPARAYQLSFSPLGLTGTFEDGVLSPDGKYIATVQTIAGKQSVHLYETATNSDKALVPPGDHTYGGLSFSRDGNYIYFLEIKAATGNLYRVTKMGGVEGPIVPNVNSAATFSPDGQQMAFFRSDGKGNGPDLMIARPDGSEAHSILHRDPQAADSFQVDMNGAGPIWSPDGTKIACPTVTRGREPQEMNVDLISVDGAHTERFTKAPWYQIAQVAWLADNTGLLLAAKREFSTPSQIYLLTNPSGEIREISHDPNNYTRISAAQDSQQLFALKQEAKSAVWAGPSGKIGTLSQVNIDLKNQILEIGDGPPGTIVVTVNDAAYDQVWLYDTLMDKPRKLTLGSFNSYRPTVSPDGKQLAFASTQAGKTNVWITSIEDATTRQLTTGNYEDMPVFTPDGQFIIFFTGRSIKRVPITGGSPERLLEKGGIVPSVSPDGNFLATFVAETNDGDWSLEIIDLRSKARAHIFAIPATTKKESGLRWSPDGKSIAYVSPVDGVDNIWLQPVSGGNAIQSTSLVDGEITSFIWDRTSPARIFCLRTQRNSAPVLMSLS